MEINTRLEMSELILDLIVKKRNTDLTPIENRSLEILQRVREEDLSDSEIPNEVKRNDDN